MNTKSKIVSISLMIASLLAACRPTTPETSTASASASSSGGGSAPACVSATERPADYACRFSTDCYDVTNCSDERCLDKAGAPCPAEGCFDGVNQTGHCDYTVRKPAGEGCDQGLGWYGTCQADGSCCPADAGTVTSVDLPR